MKKLSVKEVIEFRRKKSEQSKKTFVANLKSDKTKSNKDGGGDYWTICVSALSKAYKTNDLQVLQDKIEEVEEKLATAAHNITKAMYQRNINILNHYVDFDFKQWYPSKKFSSIKAKKADSILTIKGLEIEALPHSVFTFKKGDIDEIGAIWFVAKLNGFKTEELAMFTDITHKYLKTKFSKKYLINPKYCIAVDIVNHFDVNYSQLEENEVPVLLTSTIEDIKKNI